ncbi:MAG: fumarylacetoacetate hydrolase family protein [Planctomycetaceae bacterium]
MSYVSQLITLEPGDLIFTGTPAGWAWGVSRRSGCGRAMRWKSRSTGWGRCGTGCQVRQPERPPLAMTPDRQSATGRRPCMTNPPS